MKYNPKIVLAWMRECYVPQPETEYVFDESRLFRFDFAWIRPHLALEVEGGIWTRGAHGRGSGIKRDMEKYNLAACQGWRILRVEPKELCMQETADMILRAYHHDYRK